MNILAQLKHIKAFVFDIDGVLTTGHILVLPNGVMARSMNTKDGYALQLAVKKGYPVIVISGGKSDDVVHRLNLLGINQVYMQVSNKWACLQQLIETLQLQPQEILFMGDDVPDIFCMQQVGVAACPSNAAIDVLKMSNYISPYQGGDGCVRDVIEKVLKLQNNWHDTAHTTSV